MSRIIGTFSWTPQPGYPKLKGNKDDERIICEFMAPWSDVADNMPAYGDKFHDERYPYLLNYEELELVDKVIETMSSGKTARIQLTYGSETFSASINHENGDEDWDLDNVEVEVPLEKHPNYRTKWNHALLECVGATSAPDWWDGATDTELLPSEEAQYKWLKEGDQYDEKWSKLKAPTKPGYETYSIFVPCMIVTRYYTKERHLSSDLKHDGKRKAPPKKYCDDVELESDKKYWLQGPTTIGREGKYFVTKTKYQYAKEEVDDDLYEDASE